MPLHKCSFVTWSQLSQTVAEIVWEVLENVTFNVLLLQLFLWLVCMVRRSLSGESIYYQGLGGMAGVKGWVAREACPVPIPAPDGEGGLQEVTEGATYLRVWDSEPKQCSLGSKWLSVVQKNEGGGQPAHLFTEYSTTAVTQPEGKNSSILQHFKGLVSLLAQGRHGLA